MSWPNLQVLQLIVLVGQTGSLSQAATACGMAQPNASRAILQLERRINQNILLRSHSGSRLSKTGALIAQWAEPLLRAGTEFNAAVASLQSDIANNLEIMASQTVAECYAPGWLTKFQLKNPGVNVQMSVHNSSQIMSRVLEGDTRLGIIESPHLDERLASLMLGHDQLVLVVAASHPWARRRSPISLKKLASTPLVLREEGSGTREVLELALGSEHVAPAIVASSNSVVLANVAAGAGPTVMSRRAVAGAIKVGVVTEVGLESRQLFSRPIRAVWPLETPPRGPAASFLRAICADAASGS
ncbi:LysR family transcriptional regulator [Propionimicrobium lymphophilum]|uniref:LysR family transcriptional regulator n=1 Tax=Propionimicrobium lymphophilum TaxID=33012 RepID=UPI003EC4A610